MTPRHRPWEDAADFHIGLREIPLDLWFEGGEPDPSARKDALFARFPAEVWAAEPGSEAAQTEAMGLIEAALGRPIPRLDAPPLRAAARAVADDLCLMQQMDGAWRLTALSLCAGSFFTASEVLGRSLDALHAPVAGFAERLAPRVGRIFSGLRPDLILERRNWSVVSSPDLFAPDPAPMRAAIAGIAPADAADVLRVRVERQTLRRLPRTGAVLFTIRVWIDPLRALMSEPERLARFAAAWRTAGPEFRAYKRLDLYDDLMGPLLDGVPATT